VKADYDKGLKFLELLRQDIDELASQIVVEKHPGGYLAYPLGMKGIVIGEGNSLAPQKVCQERTVKKDRPATHLSLSIAIYRGG
jgi:hypothetical protein